MMQATENVKLYQPKAKLHGQRREYLRHAFGLKGCARKMRTLVVRMERWQPIDLDP